MAYLNQNHPKQDPSQNNAQKEPKLQLVQPEEKNSKAIEQDSANPQPSLEIQHPAEGNQPPAAEVKEKNENTNTEALKH